MYRRYLESSKCNKSSDAENEQSQPVLNGYSPHYPLFNPSKARKLILHFDARNTIFVADHSSRISVEQALNTYIAGVVWGTYREAGGWECISDAPTLCTPVPGAISMYKLMERDLVKVPSDRAHLRQALGDFTQRPVGAKFAPIFHHHLSLLAWRRPAPDPQLTVTGLDGRLYHYLIPSFLHLLAHLTAVGADFAVIIRTFGRDAPHILAALRLFTEGRHPDFPAPLGLSVCEEVELLRRGKDSYEYSFARPDGSRATLTDERAIYEHWNDCRGVVGVVDDFVHWQAHNYHFSASKPLWFDPGDRRHQHVMFDDNIRVDDEDNILNLCRLDDSHGRSLSPSEARHFQDVFFVQADLLRSTADRAYFIEQTRCCVDSLDRIRERDPTLRP